jgi:glycosyltransferase involved in cell wall biosynthesis
VERTARDLAPSTVRIALDAQLAVGSATGIGEYASGLAAALRAEGVDVELLQEPRLDPWRFDRRVLWDQVLLPARAARARAALLHCASGTVPLVRSLPVVVTVHDVAWLRDQRHARRYARWYFGAYSLARYRNCAAILTDSSFSRGELLELLPRIDERRVTVVAPGVAGDIASVQRRPDRKTILAVGTVEPRKNLAFLVRLLPKLRGARLVSTGPPTPYLLECRRLASDLGVEDRVEFRGYVARDELLGLYERAAVAAVPSRYEGFGYAVAQALCAGVPCIASDCASLPEVAGEDARVVALADEFAWLSALESALCGADDARAAASRASAGIRFSWSTAAHKMIEIYASVDR